MGAIALIVKLVAKFALLFAKLEQSGAIEALQMLFDPNYNLDDDKSEAETTV